MSSFSLVLLYRGRGGGGGVADKDNGAQHEATRRVQAQRPGSQHTGTSDQERAVGARTVSNGGGTQVDRMVALERGHAGVEGIMTSTKRRNACVKMAFATDLHDMGCLSIHIK